MKKYSLTVLASIVFILLAAGCVRLALRLSPSLIPDLTQAFFEECDPVLAKESLPADLKLMEGLLRNDPENRQLLTALCKGFAGYALLFVEEENPERASHLYFRARSYGLRALGQEAPLSQGAQLQREFILSRLNSIEEDEHEALFWTTMSWNAWINLNLDKPAALAQLNTAETCLRRVLEIAPDYLYGAPYVLMGSLLAARPGFLGGDEARARECFERAMHVSERKFFMVHYYFARYYAVRVQDRELFLKLAGEIEGTPPSALKEVCLINAVMKEKMKRLMERSEDLFL